MVVTGQSTQWIINDSVNISDGSSLSITNGASVNGGFSINGTATINDGANVSITGELNGFALIDGSKTVVEAGDVLAGQSSEITGGAYVTSSETGALAKVIHY